MVERYVEVTNEYVKQLEQEIDNLKKINEKHKKINGKLQLENQKYKETIDKAIKYIRNHQLVFKDATLEETEEWFNQFYIDVLDILKEEEND